MANYPDATLGRVGNKSEGVLNSYSNLMNSINQSIGNMQGVINEAQQRMNANEQAQKNRDLKKELTIFQEGEATKRNNATNQTHITTTGMINTSREAMNEANNKHNANGMLVSIFNSLGIPNFYETNKDGTPKYHPGTHQLIVKKEYIHKLAPYIQNPNQNPNPFKRD